jgi:DNA-binding MurR/RpiR family transcriptional regulator
LSPQTPPTFDALRQQIRSRFNDLSPHLQRIARASLEDPNTFALNTTQVIAASLEIQPSTLIRFAKEFHYAGFSDMQRVFRQRLIEGEASVREQVLASADAMGHPDGDLKGLFAASMAANGEALSRLSDTFDVDSFTQATRALRGARHVYVAGLRRSRPIADYLVYGLVRSERPSSLLDFAGGMSGPQIATLASDELLVAIAFPPYSQPVVDVVMDAHVSGRRILGITDSEASPLARYSQFALFVPSDTASPMQPIVGAIALIHALLTAVSQISVSTGTR